MLTIHIRKQPDDTGVLRCIRADGSIAWQKQERHGRFFAQHDMTHYAVESTLVTSDGFYGLIAQGWEMEETTGETTKGPLPEEAIEVEQFVSLFDAERASQAAMPAGEFNQFAAMIASQSGRKAPRKLTDSQLQTIRSAYAELSTRWKALAPGQTLEIMFEKCGQRPGT
jgi:hypothetical protein